jgi:hypothetical protein
MYFRNAYPVAAILRQYISEPDKTREFIHIQKSEKI